MSPRVWQAPAPPKNACERSLELGQFGVGHGDDRLLVGVHSSVATARHCGEVVRHVLVHNQVE